MLKFKNINSGLILTEKEYNEMLQREAENAWNEKSDWDGNEYIPTGTVYEAKEEFIKWHTEGPDHDFVVLEECQTCGEFIPVGKDCNCYGDDSLGK